MKKIVCICVKTWHCRPSTAKILEDIGHGIARFGEEDSAIITSGTQVFN